MSNKTNTIVHLKYGSIRCTAEVIHTIKSKLVRLERGYHPSRSHALDVMTHLQEEARRDPTQFTASSRAILRV